MIAFQQFSDDISPFVLVAIIVAVYGVFGIVCAVVAPSRGRSAVGWFFIGAATQCIGVILIFLLPDLKAEAAKQRRRDEETRKLRELLKKERQVSDVRDDVHRGRLTAHDRALGVDTADAETPLLASSSAPPPVPPTLPSSRAEEMWFFSAGGEQQGPVPASRLRQMWIDGRIEDQALVWREGMGDWTPIAEVVDLLDDSTS